MRLHLPKTPAVRLSLSFLLFVLTSLVLVLLPAAAGVQTLPDLALRELPLTLAILFGLPILARLAYSLTPYLTLFLTSSIHFFFALCFVLQRLIAEATRLAGLRLAMPGWMLEAIGEHDAIQVVSAFVVAGLAVLMLPRLSAIRRRSETAILERNKFLAAAESSLDDFYIFSGIPNAAGEIIDFRFAYINPNAEKRLNVRRQDLLGKVLTEVRPFMTSSGLIHSYCEVVRTGVPFTAQVFIDDHMIKGTWLSLQAVKLGDGIAVTSRDVTESKRLTDHVSHLAHYDQLTGLPNRTLLQDRLQQAILQAQRHGQKVAVFMLDIDRFKQINDSWGHADGDSLLAAIAKRLLPAIRESDTVARMGGDEFVILMPDFKSMEDVELYGRQIVQRCAEAITIASRQLSVSVSVGLCVYPDCGHEAEDLLRSADAAMYAVKNSGGNGLCIFSQDMLEMSVGRQQTAMR